MNYRADRNEFQRQTVARLNVDIGVSSDNRIPHLQPLWRQDVAPFAVGIAQQCNPRRTIRIVLDGLDFSRDIFLVALEIDQAIDALMPAAPVICGNAPVVVAPTAMLK